MLQLDEKRHEVQRFVPSNRLMTAPVERWEASVYPMSSEVSHARVWLCLPSSGKGEM
jgi:hypothetical protein